MVFSKTFGYAVRGVLYVAALGKDGKKVLLEEIAEQLKVPRHFLGKVMKKLVKEGVISSMKGPYGGFYCNEKTLTTPLFTLIEVSGEAEEFSSCILRLKKCNSRNPCPLHTQIEIIRKDCRHLLTSTSINDLLNKDQPAFIKSISLI
jgi:Rrf2 family transcriptional regulator, iron-sulfur cluster assembly transcription factor